MCTKLVGVKTLAVYTEQVRQWLISQNAIHTDFKFKKLSGYIVIPLSVSYDEIHQLLEKFSLAHEIEIYSTTFKEKEKKPQKLSQSLAEIIPEKYRQYISMGLGFDTIGDVIIIDIPEELLLFKDEIADILLSNFSSVNCIYRKASAVSGKLRVRDLEFLAGDEKCTTIHQEYGIRILVDVCNAYFSPRLANEHHRIASEVNDDEIVFDLFSGVGSFALHIAKLHQSTVYSVDINPQAISCLEKSFDLNVLQGKIIPFLGDARSLPDYLPKADRIIMNLPGSAIDFIDVACAIAKPGCKLHFYSFVNHLSPERELTNTLQTKLEEYRWNIEEIINFQKIRESAPYEIHACLDVIISPLKL